MTENYDSIGEAIGAAMAHNINLAHRTQPRPPHTAAPVRAAPATHQHDPSEREPQETSANRTERFGTDVEIFRWKDGTVWADVHPELASSSRDLVHSALRLEGFQRISPYVLPHSYELINVPPEGELRRRLSAVAENLSRGGYTVNIEPDLYTDTVLPPSHAEARRRQAALRTSPAAGTTPTPAAPSPALPPAATGPTTVRRTR